MLQHCLPCRGSRGAATLPHRLPLRSIPPQRFACGSSHSRGHGRPRSVRKSSRLRWKCLSKDCSDRRKSFVPSAPIAYATSVSPPDEAVAWTWALLDFGIGLQQQHSLFMVPALGVRPLPWMLMKPICHNSKLLLALKLEFDGRW